MKVYVFQRNGKVWADVRPPPDNKVTRTIDCRDSAEAYKLAAKESGRVQAVLERVGSDMAQMPAQIELPKGGIGKRLKWLFTGK